VDKDKPRGIMIFLRLIGLLCLCCVIISPYSSFEFEFVLRTVIQSE